MKRFATTTKQEWMNGRISECGRSIILLKESFGQSLSHAYRQAGHSIILLLILSSTALSQFRLPSYEKFELENGLTVYLMEKKDVPLISFSAVFDGGAIKDGEQSGLAAFTAEALRFGTTSYTRAQIDSLFNFYGSNIITNARIDYSGLSTQFIKENTEILLPVIKEIILNPVFPETEIERRKQRWLAELDQAKESPRAVIASYFNKHVFGDAPYGNPVNGTKAGISSLDLKKSK